MILAEGAVATGPLKEDVDDQAAGVEPLCPSLFGGRQAEVVGAESGVRRFGRLGAHAGPPLPTGAGARLTGPGSMRASGRGGTSLPSLYTAATRSLIPLNW